MHFIVISYTIHCCYFKQSSFEVFYFNCLCVCVCMDVCRCPQRPEKSVRFLGAGVAGGCEQFCGQETKLKSSGKDVGTPPLSHLSNPVIGFHVALENTFSSLCKAVLGLDLSWCPAFLMSVSVATIFLSGRLHLIVSAVLIYWWILLAFEYLRKKSLFYLSYFWKLIRHRVLVVSFLPFSSSKIFSISLSFELFIRKIWWELYLLSFLAPFEIFYSY